MVAEWPVDALKHVATEEWILNGFRQCVYFELEVNALIDRMNLIDLNSLLSQNLIRPWPNIRNSDIETQ